MATGVRSDFAPNSSPTAPECLPPQQDRRRHTVIFLVNSNLCMFWRSPCGQRHALCRPYFAMWAWPSHCFLVRLACSQVFFLVRLAHGHVFLVVQSLCWFVFTECAGCFSLFQLKCPSALQWKISWIWRPRTAPPHSLGSMQIATSALSSCRIGLLLSLHRNLQRWVVVGD